MKSRTFFTMLIGTSVEDLNVGLVEFCYLFAVEEICRPSLSLRGKIHEAAPKYCFCLFLRF